MHCSCTNRSRSIIAMNRDVDLVSKVSILEREVRNMKSVQQVAPVNWFLYKYSGTWSHDGASDKYMVFTADDNTTSTPVVMFSYQAPTYMNYLFGTNPHPDGIFYADMSKLPGTSMAWQVLSNISGSVSITTIKPS